MVSERNCMDRIRDRSVEFPCIKRIAKSCARLLIRSLDLLNRAHNLLIRSLDLLNRVHNL